MSIHARFQQNDYPYGLVGDAVSASPDVLGNTSEDAKERATNHLNFIGGAVVGLVAGFVLTSVFAGPRKYD